MTDPGNRPVSGVEVEFVVPAGAVVAPNDTVLTGADGKAAVHYTLATTAGDQLVQARAKPVVPSPSLNTAFHQTALPDVPTSLVLVRGNQQIGETGAPLRDSLVVMAQDRYGNGVAGVEVTWEANGGEVIPGSVTTGADGRAAAQRILGDRPGSYATTASAGNLEGSPVAFIATGAGPQLVVTRQPSPSASAGVPLGRQPVLQLQSPAGTPLERSGVAVTVQIASGGGSLGGQVTVRSNGAGVVTFEDLSIRGAPGARTLIFAASDFTSAISDEIDVGPGPPVPGASSAAVPNGAAGMPTEITVQLQDAFGTPVADAADRIAISVTGANPAASLTVTDRGNGSYTASYTPTIAGTDVVDVRVNGEAVPGSPFASVVGAGAADPSTTTAAISRSGFFGSTVTVVVTTRDAAGNVLGRGGDQVQMQVDGGSLVALTDRGDGTYIASFFGGFAAVRIDIFLNGNPIAGSPFTS
ncbi:MAG TPA: filamin/ABP280 repeat domain-containing protein [Gemmatimonadales bacterium]